MLVELHTHSRYSKGSQVPVEGLNTAEEMVEHARRIGLGAIAITDHDEIRGSIEATKVAKKHGMIVIPGEEVSTIDGHLLALGISDFVQPGMSVEETIDEIHSQGGIAIGDHPFDIYGDGIGRKAVLADAIEAFNAINMERLSNRRAKKFARVHGKPQVAGSDAHWTEMIGYGVNKIDAYDVDGILKAIKKGKVETKTRYIPSSILMRWTVIRMQLSYPYTIDYINKNYMWPKRVLGRNMVGLVNRSPGRIDYFFRGLAYLGLGGAMLYSVGKNVILQR